MIKEISLRVLSKIKDKADLICAGLSNMLFLTILFQYKSNLHGDMIGDLIIAFKAAQSWNPFPTNVYYSTTLPVLLGNIGIEEVIAHLGLSFQNTFFLTRIIELMIFFLLIWWILKIVYLEEKKYIFWTILMIPTYSCILMLHLGGFYLWTITTPIFLLCIYKLYVQKIIRPIIVGFFFIFPFCVGLCGAKTLLWVFVPLGGAFIVNFLWENRKCNILLGSGMIVSSMAGFLINEKVLLIRYGIKARITLEYSLLSDFPEALFKTISETLKVLGWQEEIKLISYRGILNGVSLLLLGIIIALVMYSLKCINMLDDFDRLFFLFSLFSFFISAYLLIFTKENVSAMYLTPSIYALTFWCCIFWFKYYKHNVGKKEKIILLSILIFFYLFSWKNMYSVFVDERREIVLEQDIVLEVLKEKGYEYGYATFWHSMPITAASDFQIESTNISIVEEGFYYYRWLSPKEYYDKDYYRGNVFVVLHESEKELFNGVLAKKDIQIPDAIFDDGFYTIYEMDNKDIIKCIIE